MAPKMKSMNDPRGYSGSGNRAYTRTGGGGNSVAKRQSTASTESRISPWLPVAVGVFALFVIGTALAKDDRRRYTRSNWSSRLRHDVSDKWNDWWPEIRDTAEETGSRARSWFNDVAPSRRTVSDLFNSSTDWLPDARASKRRLLANFDWSNPPRWLRDIDLSSPGKRRRFLKDLKRYSTRKSDSLMSSLGLS
jgi:hypothetical protein